MPKTSLLGQTVASCLDDRQTDTQTDTQTEKAKTDGPKYHLLGSRFSPSIF